MNTKQIVQILTSSGIAKNEATIEAKMLVEKILGLSSIDLAINPDFSTNEILNSAIQKRAQKHIPIQYILGEAYFMGEYFKVDENVLIPRDETEILVRKAIEIINKNDFKTVLDIGTGSGCIACMIAKNTQAQVLGVDISTAAISIALDNSSKMNLFNKAIFRKSNLFERIKQTEKCTEKFDLIISNPPYIPLSQQKNLQIELNFEPKMALFTNDEKGVEFYNKITSQAKEYLTPKGYLMFELGINQSEIVKKMFVNNGFNDIEIEKDLAYIDRIIYGRV